MLPFGIFGLIAYSLFYFLNKFFFLPQDGYDSIALRIIIALLCFSLIIKNYWPKRLKKFLPLFWYFVLMFTMPFFITFMMLKNNLSAAWILNELSIVIIMMLLVNWVMYAVVFIIGMGCSLLAFYLTSSTPILFMPGTLEISDLINTFSITIIMGLVFSYKKDQYENFRLSTAKITASSMAHELKTPLSTISVRSDIIHQDIVGCQLLIDNNRDVELSLIDKFKKILENLRLIYIEIDRSNLFINILLRNLTYPQKIKFSVCQIKQEVLQAIQRYPFTDKEAGLIKLGQFTDFEYMGNADLTIHVIFNLIRNSLYSILTAGRGEIIIETKITKDSNQLIFFDNGVGIEKEVLPFIFDQFYSKKRHGYGIGLAYCKLIMKSYGGNIYCISEVGKYAKFILEFPKVLGAN